MGDVGLPEKVEDSNEIISKTYKGPIFKARFFGFLVFLRRLSPFDFSEISKILIRSKFYV